MRCKKHFSDPSSSVGVCATCLRQRLLSVIDAQSQPLPLPPVSDDDRRSSETKYTTHHLPPPPLIFPRSVSPYISRRKSDTGDDAEFSDERKQMFFSTPQIGPSFSKQKKKSKFNLFSNLFRSGSSKSRKSLDPYSDRSLSISNPKSSLTSSESYASPSSSWIPRGRNSILRLSSLDETGLRREKGMSPDVGLDIGCSPEGWRRSTPSSVHGSTRPSHARATASPARSQLASGFGLCMSPLMRPGTARHWKGRAGGPETGYSVDIGPAVKPNLSTASTHRANRSRKLAEFGRFDNKH